LGVYESVSTSVDRLDDVSSLQLMDDGIRSATTMSPRPENSTHSSLSFRFAKSSPCGGGGHDVCAAAAAFLHLRRRQGRGVHISFPVRFVRKGRVALVYRRRDFCVAGTSTNLRGTPMPNCSRLSVHSLLSLQCYSGAAIRTLPRRSRRELVDDIVDLKRVVHCDHSHTRRWPPSAFMGCTKSCPLRPATTHTAGSSGSGRAARSSPTAAGARATQTRARRALT
jgi:hypothetical protein